MKLDFGQKNAPLLILAPILLESTQLSKAKKNFEISRGKLEIIRFNLLDKDMDGPEVIKVRVVTIDVLSIGIKFQNFMQAGCRDLGSHCRRTVYCRKPIILPKLVLFFGTFLELPVLPSFICGLTAFLGCTVFTNDSSTLGRHGAKSKIIIS